MRNDFEKKNVGSFLISINVLIHLFEELSFQNTIFATGGGGRILFEEDNIEDKIHEIRSKRFSFETLNYIYVH